MNGITIHPPGIKLTDAEKAAVLALSTPTAFQVSQNLMVAAEKFRNNKGGLFSLRKSRIKNLQALIYELSRALRTDGFSTNFQAESDTEILFIYLSAFSDAFPNWQPEYETLNRFIPQCF